MGEGLFEVERITERSKTPGKPTKPVRDHETKNIFPPTLSAPPLLQEARDPLDKNRPKSIDAFETPPMKAFPYPISDTYNASGSSSNTVRPPASRYLGKQCMETPPSFPGHAGKEGASAAAKQAGQKPMRGDRAPAGPDNSRGLPRI